MINFDWFVLIVFKICSCLWKEHFLHCFHTHCILYKQRPCRYFTVTVINCLRFKQETTCLGKQHCTNILILIWRLVTTSLIGKGTERHILSCTISAGCCGCLQPSRNLMEVSKNNSDTPIMVYA